MPTALLFAVDEGRRHVRLAAGDPEPLERTEAQLDSLGPVLDAATTELPIRLKGAEAGAVATAIGVHAALDSVLLVPARRPGGGEGYVLMLGDVDERSFSLEEVEAVSAFVGAAGASLAQVTLLEHGSRQVERQSALARAAKALNESLDLGRVLPRICDEAAAILDADGVAVYRGSQGRGLVLEASSPAQDITAGMRLEPGAGLAGRVIAGGRPLLTNDYPQDAGTSHEPPLPGVRSALAAPMRWDGESRGVLWVGYVRERTVTEAELGLLESFAELAAVACRNASVHAGLAEAARTDALTGCLNHAALHETLRREMQRSRRTGRRLSIVMVDLDHFKDVNEQHGHLVGDEVLRRVGRALREAVRPYDFVARYGGDEFAIVAVDAHEERAAEIGERAIARIGDALAGVESDAGGPHATAGVSQWTGSDSPSDLVRDADRALLYGKQQGVRGAAVRASIVPEGFMLGRPVDQDERPPEGAAAPWPSEFRRETEPLRKRTRQLALANALGSRLAALNRTDDIVEATVEELRDGFGYALCALVTLGADQSLDAVALRGEGVTPTVPRRWRELRETEAVERALIERRAVIANEQERRFSRDGASAEIAIPVWSGAELWGALDVQSEREFEEPDVRLLQTVADQVGSALRSASLYEDLEWAYLGTAEAVTAALDSRDAFGPEHSRRVVANAEAVGRLLGMSADELRDLRYAAAFHDIGKLKVAESVLNKPGPLTQDEWLEVRHHADAVEEILGSVDYLAPVIPLVRHCHERWDGGGYPDGLAGERIPLGARVLLICDAHDAMRRDRPYRPALSEELARREIRTEAGRQFDSRVADAFLTAVDGVPAA